MVPNPKQSSRHDQEARAIEPREAWELVERGEVQLLDLRTGAERRRYGAPPGATPVSLVRHIARPQGEGTIYLCQHAVRSKATLRNGAAEVAGGFVAWKKAGLPIEKPDKRIGPESPPYPHQ